jgi:hypothetical protein
MYRKASDKLPFRCLETATGALSERVRVNSKVNRPMPLCAYITGSR